MKKKLLSLFLTACLLCSGLSVSAAASFTDIPDPDTALAATVLQSMGIVSGVGTGLYSPDTVLTRAQFCTFMVHTLGMKDVVDAHSYKTLFTDVKPGNWYTGYVNLAYSQNLLSGYGNGKFGPDDPVTYGQAATLLLRMLGYSSTDIGKVWPTDYVNYARTLELDEGLSLSADQSITRGQAAILLYNTLKTEPKGAIQALYNSFSDTATVQKAIILDANTEHGTASHQLMACVVTAAGASIEYFSQKNQISSFLVGYEGDLLLNASGKALGFVPDSTEMKDIVIGSAKASGITDAAGLIHRITGNTVTIVGDDLYVWNDTGYIQADALSGRVARLYYDDDGVVSYIYISTGRADTDTAVAIAQTGSAAAELARKLGVSDYYSITKNGCLAQAEDLAKYDTAYFDTASRTLCVSDYRITGFIEAASPSLVAAETVTVSGCTLPVLESAWDSLEQFRLGDNATLLLTDDLKVAAALPSSELSADMIGILSIDGRSVTLSPSGLTISAPEVEAKETLCGTLVEVYVNQDSISCFAYTSNVPGKLDIRSGTLGGFDLAPGCQIYEHSGSTTTGGYVYSLDGELGVPSSDFDDIFWTDTIARENIRQIHLNGAGQVDVILLNDVTGNAYTYGELTRYTGFNGIMTASSPKLTYNDAATITNAAGQSQKYLFSRSVSAHNAYFGIGLRSYNDIYQDIVSLVRLTSSEKLTGSAFFLQDDDWHVTAAGYELPVSEKVQVYIESADRWLSGPDGIKAAISSGQPLIVHYDKTPTTGAQVRVIVVS